MQLLPKIDAFIEYLAAEKGLSKNTLISYRYDLAHYKRFIDEKGLQYNAKEAIREYLSLETEAGRAPSTLKRRFMSLKNYFQFLLLEGDISSNPLHDMSPPKLDVKLPNVLSEDEVERLFVAVKSLPHSQQTRMRVLLEIFYATGARVSEILSLKWNSVNLTEGTLRIKGKGGKERLVFLTESAINALEDFKGEEKHVQSSGWIFRGATGHHLTRQRFFQLLKKLAEIENLPTAKVHPHALRHAFATHLLKRGMDLVSLKKLLGHANLSTTEIYTFVNYKDLEDILIDAHPLARKIKK